ncbi:MAG: hypothetical protein EHM33_29160 [Chloroflexi bacterium]|nr:MAG: hypothetical protein EHM33_29160 [Chloroflexota bacterium]
MTKLEVFRDEELYIIERGGRYAVHGMLDGKRVRKSCGTNNLAQAKIILDSIRRQHEMGWADDYNDPNKSWRDVAKEMWSRAKHSADKRGIPFELRPGDVYHLMKLADYRCSLSGILLSKRIASDGRRDPWAASLDRIESRHGYTPGNVRIVCMIANFAMNEWGQDTLLRLARGMIRNADAVVPEPEKMYPASDTPVVYTNEINSL